LPIIGSGIEQRGRHNGPQHISEICMFTRPDAACFLSYHYPPTLFLCLGRIIAKILSFPTTVYTTIHSSLRSILEVLTDAQNASPKHAQQAAWPTRQLRQKVGLPLLLWFPSCRREPLYPCSRNSPTDTPPDRTSNPPPIIHARGVLQLDRLPRRHLSSTSRTAQNKG